MGRDEKVDNGFIKWFVYLFISIVFYNTIISNKMILYGNGAMWATGVSHPIIKTPLTIVAHREHKMILVGEWELQLTTTFILYV